MLYACAVPDKMEVTRTTFVLLLFFTTIATTNAVTSDVIAPTKEEKTEAALIIVPGASIDGEAYRPLGEFHGTTCWQPSRHQENGLYVQYFEQPGIVSHSQYHFHDSFVYKLICEAPSERSNVTS